MKEKEVVTILQELAGSLSKIASAEKDVSPQISRLTIQLKQQMEVSLRKKDLKPERRVVHDATKIFLNTLTNKHTARAYNAAFERYHKWCNIHGLQVEHVQYQDFYLYLDDLKNSYELPTIRLHVTALRRIYDWLMTHGFLPSNPAPILRTQHEIADKPRNNEILSLEEIRTLLSSFNDTDIRDLRNRAMIGLILYAFVPNESLTELHVKDYISEQGKYYINANIRNKPYKIPLHSEASAFIQKYLNVGNIAHTPEASLFLAMNSRSKKLPKRRHSISISGISQSIKGSTKKAHLPEITSRQLRLAGIIALLQSSATKNEVRMLIGRHSSKTIERYEQFMGQQPHLGELFDSSADIAKPLQEFIQQAGIFNLSENKNEE